MQSERHSGSSPRTKLAQGPRAGAGSFRMMVTTVFVGVVAVLFAQGYSLPGNLIEGVRSIASQSPLFLGITVYLGLMVFLGCCLFLIPREDRSELETEA
jgi:hypothetical protein